METQDTARGAHAKKTVRIGYRLGKLTVVERSDQRHNGYVVWRCACDCGGEILLDTRAIRRGAAQDCGCSGISRANRNLRGRRFEKLVCLEPTEGRDGDGSVLWRCRCDCGNECLASASRLTQGIKKSCGCLQREAQRRNLKLVDGTSVTMIENRMRRPIRSNTSGCSGVYKNRRSNKWAAQITFKGKTYYLGQFDDLQDAIKIRKRGEEMYSDFLEWYYQEHPAPQK